MQAWYAHEMRIHSVNKEKPGPPYVKRPVCGGKVFSVYFRRAAVESAHGFKEIQRRFQGPEAECSEHKPQAPDPEGDKIQIDVHLAGRKGYFPVQSMIRPGNRYATRQKSGFVLKKEKVPENG